MTIRRNLICEKYLTVPCRKYLEDKLKLKMNVQKSKVVSALATKHFKFLGFCLGKRGKSIYIRAHCESLLKAKRKLKELTRRSQGKNVRVVFENVMSFMRGWLGYYHVAEIKRTIMSWYERLRRRFRMYIWKQWKNSKTRVTNLKQLGILEWQAYQ